MNALYQKIKQRNVGKITENKSEIPGERLFIDIGSIKAESYGGSKFWVLVLDDCTDKCWSFFIRRKSDMPEKVVELVKKLRSDKQYTIKHIVKKIRCDNAGENNALEKLCEKEELGIKFEYTSPGSPQFNGKVERKFATLFARVRTMMNSAKIPRKMREGLWAEAADTASQIEDRIVTPSKPIAAYNKFYNIKEEKLKTLKPFGSIGIVEINKTRKIRGKLEDRGRPCMYLGQARNHADDVYRFLDLTTNRIILSRDVIWLNKMYGEWKGMNKLNINQTESDSEDEELILSDNEEDNQKE